MDDIEIDSIVVEDAKPKKKSARSRPKMNGNDSKIKNGPDIVVGKLRCAVCGWMKNSTQSRRSVGDHVFIKHVPPVEDRNLPLYRCLVCSKEMRQLLNHMYQAHQIKCSQLVDGQNYCKNSKICAVSNSILLEKFHSKIFNRSHHSIISIVTIYFRCRSRTRTVGLTLDLWTSMRVLDKKIQDSLITHPNYTSVIQFINRFEKVFFSWYVIPCSNADPYKLGLRPSLQIFEWTEDLFIT